LDGKRHEPIEQMEVFRRYVEIADWAWDEVQDWSPLARDTVGKQLIRAADSIGANMVEGDGRFTDADGLHFFIIARASAREARYWIQQAVKRNLVSAEEGDAQTDALAAATQLLSRLINYRRAHKAVKVTEAAAPYVTPDDPFVMVFPETTIAEKGNE